MDYLEFKDKVAKGVFWFASYEGALRGELFVALVRRLMNRHGKALRLLDDPPGSAPDV